MKFDPEKLKEIWEKVKTAVGKVSRKVWIIAAVVIVVVAAGITIFLNTRPYSVLVTGASASEISFVANWLEERGVKTYRYQGMDTILVPESQAPALKASLLTEMYSDGSADYSGYFDRIGMLSTEAERNNAWQIALQQKLEAVIGSMEGVQMAEVVITPGEDRGYVLDSGNVVAATASVKVTMRSGKALSSQLASAIRAYVSTGVQGLKVENVTIIDSYGNQYHANGIDPSADTAASALKLQMEQEYENRVRSNVMQVLEAFYGTEGVRVAVNLEIELGNQTVDEHQVSIPEYIPGRENGKGIIGAEVWGYQYYASNEVIDGGLVGTGVNSDIVTDVEKEPDLDDTDGKIQGNGQVEYNNPYKDIHTVYTAGRVTDCTISVSLDANIVPNPDVPALISLVANAAGITAIATEDMTAAEYLSSKISVYSGPFYTEPNLLPGSWWPFEDIVPGWIVLAALAGLLLFVIILVVVLVLVGRRKKKRALEEAERLQQEQLAEQLLSTVGAPQLEPVGADVMSLQTEKSMELRQDIRQFAEENPEVAAQLLRSWLRGGEENG